MQLSSRAAFLAPACLTVFLAAPAGAAVDPALLNLVMPGAKVVAGIQVQRVLESPFGQFLAAQIPQNNAMLQFAAATGFDVKRDLSEILVASDMATGANGRATGLVAVRGNFDAAKLIAFANSAGAPVTDFMGRQIVTPAGGVATNSFVFLDSSTMVGGPLDLVKNALERSAANATFSGPLAQKAQAASAANEVWIATVTPVADLMTAPKPPIPANLVGMVQELSAGIHFDANGATLSTELLTPSEQDAQSLAAALKLVFGMVQANPQALPVRDAQFASEGPVMKMSLSVPESQMEQLAQPRSGVRKISIQH